jgi:hypothetical protein
VRSQHDLDAFYKAFGEVVVDERVSRRAEADDINRKLAIIEAALADENAQRVAATTGNGKALDQLRAEFCEAIEEARQRLPVIDQRLLDLSESIRAEENERAALAARVERLEADAAHPLQIMPPKGERGEVGPPGEKGERGEPGPPGVLSASKPWTEGVHYENDLVFLDGSTWMARKDTATRPPHDDWLPVALAGRDARTGDARGLYESEISYRLHDVVAFDGSEWRARSDNPGPLPGDGWMLSARAGSKGKPGERGPAGERGLRGPPGPGIEELRIEDWDLVVQASDGQTHRCDLYGLFARFREELPL